MRLLSGLLIVLVAIATLMAINILSPDFAAAIFGLLLALGKIAASLFGLWLGVMLVLFIVVPLVAKMLINYPNRYRPTDKPGQDILAKEYPPSTFAVFTKLIPGRVKIIERGGRFMRCIMAYDHHHFKGENSANNLSPGHADYWEVVESDTVPESHPIPFPIHGDTWYRVLYLPVSLGWWAWKRWVYRWTGYVFTGIPPFQTLKVYPMQHYDQVQKADGTTELLRVEDWSDHYRVAHFQYPMIVPESDTKDKASVRTFINAIGQVINPYATAYNTDDDWPTRFSNEYASQVTEYTRPRTLDDVLSAKDEDEAGTMAKTLTQKVSRALKAIGIKIIKTQIPDISPTKDEVKARLDAEAMSAIQKRADKNLAEGQAAYVSEAAKAAKEADGLSPEGIELARIRANVEVAKAAGPKGNLVVLNGGANTAGEATNLLLLRELRRINADEKETTP